MEWTNVKASTRQYTECTNMKQVRIRVLEVKAVPGTEKLGCWWSNTNSIFTIDHTWNRKTRLLVVKHKLRRFGMSGRWLDLVFVNILNQFVHGLTCKRLDGGCDLLGREGYKRNLHWRQGELCHKFLNIKIRKHIFKLQMISAKHTWPCKSSWQKSFTWPRK